MMYLMIMIPILLGLFIAEVIYITKGKKGALKVGMVLSVVGVAVLLTYPLFLSLQNEETPTSAPVITTTAPETVPEITTVEIDGITYAVMDDKLYEIVKE